MYATVVPESVEQLLRLDSVRKKCVLKHALTFKRARRISLLPDAKLSEQVNTSTNFHDYYVKTKGHPCTQQPRNVSGVR